MPRALPKLAAVVDERLENGFRRREINQREQIELDGDQFPDAQNQNCGGDKRRASRRPATKWRDGGEDDSDNQQSEHDCWKSMRGKIQAAGQKEIVNAEGEERRERDQKWRGSGSGKQG